MYRIALLSILALAGCNTQPAEKQESSSADTMNLLYEGEVHLKNVRQLTFGGDNAEAYWSYDDDMLVFQRTSHKDGVDCDQIYWGEIPASGQDFDFNLVSTGAGRTTCSFFLDGDSLIVYASTHLMHDTCPAVPPAANGDYVWPLYPEFELFLADLNGNIVEQLTDNDYYDAEATMSPDGSKMVFTSTRSGDIELYVMDMTTRDIIQVTDEPGYDGGAFFSPDGSKLVWRSSRFDEPGELQHYKDLLAKDMVSPSKMEIYVANIDGTEKVRVTDLGGANWAPYFHPSGEKIIFCSNHKTKGFQFNLFMVNIDGTGLEQITFDPTFDSFPMFSRDGTQIVFASNRNNGGGHETNLFIADWVD